ncbi:MAG: alpha/beta fold hydrolase [Candidatus Bathyarchaeia archaeon]
MSGQVTILPDGRRLGYTKIGKGAPVIYFHGTASSRLEVLLLKNLADKAQLQLISVDRPGYGLSTYKPRKNLQDFNGDLNCLIDELGLEQFAVLGWSGGGVFALSYCTYNPKRVTKAVLAGIPSLPFDVSTAHNIPYAHHIMKLPFVGELAMRQLSNQLIKANGDTAAFMATRHGKHLLNGCSKRDLTFFTDPLWIGLLYQSMVEAFRQGNLGVKAVVAEHQLFIKPWTLPFSEVYGSNLWIWHGAQDLTCRVSNAYANIKALPNANLEVFPDSGHCVMFEHQERLGKILSQN